MLIKEIGEINSNPYLFTNIINDLVNNCDAYYPTCGLVGEIFAGKHSSLAVLKIAKNMQNNQVLIIRLIDDKDKTKSWELHPSWDGNIKVWFTEHLIIPKSSLIKHFPELV